MRMSNRSYAADVSRHLAEMGIEEELRNLNGYGNWVDWGTSGTTTSADWTVSGTTATCTITFPTGRFGAAGLLPTVVVRVDKYGASTWRSTGVYTTGTVVWNDGLWYQCTTPNGPLASFSAANWKSTPMPWNAGTYYAIGDIVLVAGSAYRCIAANANTTPPDALFWTVQTAAVWSAATTYALNDVALLGGTAYRCILAHTNFTPPNATYWASAPVIYSEGRAVLPKIGTYNTTTGLSSTDAANLRTQLRANIVVSPLFPNALGASISVNLASGGTVDSYHFSKGTYGTQLATSTNYSAVVSGGNSTGNAVAISNATVRGYVSAPPGAAGVSYAPRLTYSSATLTGSAATGVDLTRVSRSPNIPKFSVLPVTGATNLFLTNNSTNSIGTAGATAPSIYNITSTAARINSIDQNTASDVLRVVGPVILNVANDLRVSNGSIVITSTGSLVIVYGGTMSVAGSGGIDNQTLDPKRLLIVNNGVSGTHTYSTSRALFGCIYLPNATSGITIGTGIIHGAVSATNITFSGAATVRYDVLLRHATFSQIETLYNLERLRELTNPAERVSL